MSKPVAQLLSLFVAVSLVGLPSTAAAAPGDTQVDAPNVYLHSESGEPWGSPTNQDAMNQTFGTNWDREFFQTVDTGTGPGGLFSSDVRFIFLDGSDDGALALEAFLADHEDALRAFVEAGGRLLLNSAPNEGDGMSYDGKQIVYGGETSTDSSHVVAADADHPIFNGPNTPVGTRFSGSSFGHALIQGEGLTPVILRTVGDEPEADGDPDAVVLAQYCTGPGLTLLGGMTTTNWHSPEEEAANLRANILDYAANATACAAQQQPPQEQPPQQQPPQQQQPPPVAGSAPSLRVTGLPRRCVRRNFRIRVRTSSNTRRTTVRLNGRRIARSAQRSFTVRVRARRLRVGTHRLRVRAVSTTGERRTVRRSFTRCAPRAPQPRFTG
jgi:hypothetical protein